MKPEKDAHGFYFTHKYKGFIVEHWYKDSDIRNFSAIRIDLYDGVGDNVNLKGARTLEGIYDEIDEQIAEEAQENEQ